MGFETITEGVTKELMGSLQRFLLFEQQNLWMPERLRTSTPDVQFNDLYLPENGIVFRLPCFWVRRKYLYCYGTRRNSLEGLGIAEGDGSEARVLFPIHPAESQHYTEFLAHVWHTDATTEARGFWATPTSSTRTLLVWPEGRPNDAFFAKLSIHSRVLGDRRLQRRRVASSVGLSRLVQRCICALPSGLSYFPEILGLVPRLIPDCGVIFRAIPDEVMEGTVVPAPLFALIGGSSEHPPLLLELMGKEGFKVRDFIEEVLLARFAGIWVDLVFGFGLILEAHAQDLLLALSPEGIPLGSFYYRDFEGLAVDWALRRSRGLPEPVSLPHSCEWFGTYETWGYPLYQLVFCKMRTSLFDYLHLVLAELESAVAEWQTSGVMTGPKVWEGELTFLFSRYLRKAIQERFGMKEEHEYDIHKDLNRFVKFLMQVRREVMTSRA